MQLSGPSWVFRIIRNRNALRVVSILAGCLTGFFVFAIAHTSGIELYIISGGIAGAASISVYEFYVRTARLSEIKITVPQLSELTFVVNNDSRQVAWRLFIEIITRTSTQPLQDDQGVVREALTSLYGLFATTRDALKAGRPSVPAVNGLTVENLAINMLNHELRPFLSKWHPLLKEFEDDNPGRPESEWSRNAECRTQLRALQTNMSTYVSGFAKLAGASDASVLGVPE